MSQLLDALTEVREVLVRETRSLITMVDQHVLISSMELQLSSFCIDWRVHAMISGSCALVATVDELTARPFWYGEFVVDFFHFRPLPFSIGMEEESPGTANFECYMDSFRLFTLEEVSMRQLAKCLPEL